MTSTPLTPTEPQPPSPTPSPRRVRDRIVDLVALLSIVVVSTAVYDFAGGVALIAVDTTAATLYTLWRRNSR